MTDSKHILLVDDEEEIINYLERFLRRFKITSTKVTSGEQALSVYDRNAMDFVFLDIHLKGMDGFTVLTELKRTNPDVKVIIIAGSSEKESRDRARALGALDYISKPLDLGNLKEKLDQYVL
ncbi:MAG: response regulator [Endomicrobiales bacterium]